MKKLGLAGALVLLGCGGGDGGTDPEPVPPGGELTASLSGPAERQGQAGEVLSQELEVTVRRDGQPASGITVQFAVPDASCGKAVTGSVVTGQDGIAKDRWQLGSKAGACRLEVRTIEKTGATPVLRGSFTANVSPAAADTVSLWTNFVFSGVNRVTIPLGDSVKLSTVVRRAADRFGNEIAAPTVEATRTKGTATIRGGWIVAPAVEEMGEMQVKVGNVISTVPLSSVRDLRDSKWALNLLCRDVTHITRNGTRLDSIRYDVVSDSVVYYALGDPRLVPGEARGPVGSFFFSGRQRAWLANGTVDTTIVTNWRRELMVQAKDTLAVLHFTAQLYKGPAVGPAVRSSLTPPTYTGGTFCDDSTGLKTSPKMVLTAQP